MRSWLRSMMGPSSSATPLTVGTYAPSISASSKPCGLRVMEATETPGLPMVVTSLVSSSSRPVAEPLSTRTRGPAFLGAAGRES